MRPRRPAVIAIAPLAAATVVGLIACGGYASNSYAVAGAFAAAAAAAQVYQSQSAKAAAASGGSCALATCGGCCDAHGHCWSGGGDSTCGAGGGACEDCTQEDSVCAGGACYSPGAQSAPAGAPVYWGAPTCNADACPACPLGSRCCSPSGGCSCTIGNLCP
jgi:hypothetical protein